jgi:hypothetical protein
MNETIIKIIEENGQVKILMNKDAQNGNRPDQVAARQLVQIAQKIMQPGIRNQFQQFQNQMKNMGFNI